MMTRSPGISIVSGERPQKKSSSTSELQQLLLLIVETVTCLLKLSTPPRKVIPEIRAMSQASSEVAAISRPSRGSDGDSNSKTTLQSSTPVNSDPLPELYVALTHGDVDLVEKLLENDADADERSPQGVELRQMAAVYGVTEALEILKAGADAAERRS